MNKIFCCEAVGGFEGTLIKGHGTFTRKLIQEIQKEYVGGPGGLVELGKEASVC